MRPGEGGLTGLPNVGGHAGGASSSGAFSGDVRNDAVRPGEGGLTGLPNVGGQVGGGAPSGALSGGGGGGDQDIDDLCSMFDSLQMAVTEGGSIFFRPSTGSTSSDPSSEVLETIKTFRKKGIPALAILVTSHRNGVRGWFDAKPLRCRRCRTIDILGPRVYTKLWEGGGRVGPDEEAGKGGDCAL